MSKINKATDTDPCLILAGTSLKVIDPVRKNFLTGLKDYSNSAGSVVLPYSIGRSMPKDSNSKRYLSE